MRIFHNAILLANQLILRRSPTVFLIRSEIIRLPLMMHQMVIPRTGLTYDIRRAVAIVEFWRTRVEIPFDRIRYPIE